MVLVKGLFKGVFIDVGFVIGAFIVAYYLKVIFFI